MAEISKDAALDAVSPGVYKVVEASDKIHAQIYASGNAQPAHPGDIDLADGRHRHIIYDSVGSIEQIKDSGDGHTRNLLDSFQEWDRLKNGSYMGVLPHPGKASEFVPADTLQVSDMGAIRLTAHKGDLNLSAVVQPGGVESRTVTRSYISNYKLEFEGKPDGSWKDQAYFPSGTRMNVTYGPFDKTKNGSDIETINLKGGGGSLAITNMGNEAAWTAKSPSGETTKGSITEVRLKEISELISSNQNLSIDWYTGKNHKNAYEIVTDQSGILDWLKREMKHAKDHL